MTRVLLAPADALRRDALAEGVAFLSPAERARWSRFTRPERREQFRLGRWLLRRALTGTLGGRPSDWRIAAEGPPLAVHVRGWRAPWLSLSHSGTWFAAALSRLGPVGIDLETRGRRRPWADLARHQGWRLGPGDPERAFLRRWTAFEAAYKCPQAPRLRAFSSRDLIGTLAGPQAGPPPLLCALGRLPAGWHWA